MKNSSETPQKCIASSGGASLLEVLNYGRVRHTLKLTFLSLFTYFIYCACTNDIVSYRILACVILSVYYPLAKS